MSCTNLRDPDLCQRDTERDESSQGMFFDRQQHTLNIAARRGCAEFREAIWLGKSGAVGREALNAAQRTIEAQMTARSAISAIATQRRKTTAMR